ncbi:MULTISPECIES: [Fe-Fe] hydrogenase large subunit C-terminal domain-containing protein [Pelosinus]|uniref:Hydrogenase large subunit domain protein n=1 Tax=Pelosinus fermentans B4 TaxID=1149862 RepID=I8REY9_9FIRM|nr:MULTISPECIES: [Fe-Fe] hydrogenase large subunit C-terminal domain-containing protein [Pelosinus]EIW17998.1 hydrogenase large subunit domain protein [Pelosinus fermentans B4]EIW23960.1 hydrogenase large subunit domain protein [Pelosinus fermentans A11]OAM94883.1 Ferredoxin hydrogenase [Pelosinus fermentans DSM 17108]SDR19604.1 Iron only hydrogenase large subunit, C-terminal domain [Pelosinus fermentans]
MDHTTLNIKPRILYHVAKAAWEGTLFDRREEICTMVSEEFQDKHTRRQVANQIRIAMGLDPHDNDLVLNDYDEEALMGMSNDSIIITNPDACQSCPTEKRNCEKACPLQAITRDDLGKVSINQEKCLGEGHCIQACSFGALAEKSQFVPLINLLKQHSHPVYASIAPAFAGQFGAEVTPGKLRSALLKMGFTDVLETALYADLITMKEAFEFDEHVKTDQDFMFTSCCCPVWIKLIENKFPDLMEHISPSVSPMIASARVIKQFEPDAKVVFIGPCIAKKSEALLPDVKGAIDYVLTFQELATIFEATNIHPADQEDHEKAVASWGGRVYAYTGGVSAAVATTLEKLIPHKVQKLVSLKVDGIPDCQKLLEQIRNGQFTANFIEGMACKGGCVGGPGRLLPPEEGREHVKKYGAIALANTPVENPQVYTILARLGHDSGMPGLSGKSPMAELLSRKLVQD